MDPTHPHVPSPSVDLASGSDLRATLPVSEPIVGSLPSRSSRQAIVPHAAFLTRDGVLRVGQFTLSLDGMMRHLDAFAKMTQKIADTFPNQNALVRVLPNGEIPIPPAALNFSSAFDTFKAAQAREIGDLDFKRASRQLEYLREGDGLSKDELERVRHLLMTGARLATVCAGVDIAIETALEYRSFLQRGKDWLFDRAGSIRLSDSRIRTRLMSMPFEEFHASSRRIDADLMAQRIELRDDGSPSVRIVGGAERAASELLSEGYVSRSVWLSQGAVEGEIVVRELGKSSARGAELYAGTHRVDDVFSGLQLGQAASELVESMRQQGVDLVRLCKFIDRSVALGLKVCLEALPPQAHTRLSDVDAWASRFDTQRSRPLTDEDRGELGTLLLDAEMCLQVVGHLQCVTRTPNAQALWSKLWAVSLRDREVKAAQRLVNGPTSLLECDCSGAAGALGSAAMLLGFHAEDRVGAAWRVPENPVVSLAWALHR